MIHDPGTRQPNQRIVLLDLLVTSTGELIGDIKIKGSPGCSDPALVEFAVLRDMDQVKRASN